MITPIEIVQRNLRPYFPGVDVVSKVPTVRPDFFFRIDMGAPARINLIQYRTLIIIQVYSTDLGQVIDSLFEASDVAENLSMLDPLVSGVDDLTGPVELEDPDIPHVHRWQFTFQLYSTLD